MEDDLLKLIASLPPREQKNSRVMERLRPLLPALNELAKDRSRDRRPLIKALGWKCATDIEYRNSCGMLRSLRSKLNKAEKSRGTAVQAAVRAPALELASVPAEAAAMPAAAAAPSQSGLLADPAPVATKGPSASGQIDGFAAALAALDQLTAPERARANEVKKAAMARRR